MNRTLLTSLAFTAALTVWADYPAGYYDALDGKTGIALKQTAKKIVRNHTPVSYGDKTWEAFRTTDVIEINGRQAWWDMYSDEVVYLPGHDGLNIEHSVANSWWGKNKSIDAYKDLFHLNPSDATANNRKANYPLGEISGTPSWTNGVTTVGKPVSGQGGGCASVFEPKDCYKGDFARAFMYIFTVYDDISWAQKTAWMYDYPMTELSFKPWAAQLLLKWNDADPVDKKESDRNDAIYKIQHNRNPYIDLPDLCHYIWGDRYGTPYNPGGGQQPVEPGTSILDCGFENGGNISDYLSEGWTNFKVSGSLSGWYVTSFGGNNYAACSAYKGTADGGPYEYWLITPAISLSGRTDAMLTFRTQGAYGVEGSSLKVYALDMPNPLTANMMRELPAKVCTPQPVGAKPVYSDWMQSGEVSLDGLGDNLYIGFRYYSEKGGADNSATYCLDDVKVTSEPVGTTVGDIIDSADGMLMATGVQGGIRLICPDVAEGVTIYDITGRTIASLTVAGDLFVELPAGIYIVAAPGKKSVKTVVR